MELRIPAKKCNKIKAKANKKINNKNKNYEEIEMERKTTKTKPKYKPYANLDWEVPISFNMMSGPRWKLPVKLKTTPSIQFKFEKLSTFSQAQIMEAIKEEIIIQRYNFASCTRIRHNIFPLSTSIIESYRTKQQNEWKKVKAIYIMLFRFSTYMKKLVKMWRINKIMKNQKNTVDIVTMDPPKKPVYVVDHKQKCCYVYEAKTIIRTIENRLYVSDYMFPNPQIPINPLSNQKLKMGQLISIYNQCKAHGEFSWVFDRLRNCNFSVAIFSVRFKQALKIEAINQFFKLDTVGLRDTVIDYFSSQAESAFIPESSIQKFTSRFELKTRFHLFNKWVRMTRDYYISAETKDAMDLLNLSVESSMLLKETYEII